MCCVEGCSRRASVREVKSKAGSPRYLGPVGVGARGGRGWVYSRARRNSAGEITGRYCNMHAQRVCRKGPAESDPGPLLRPTPVEARARMERAMTSWADSDSEADFEAAFRSVLLAAKALIRSIDREKHRAYAAARRDR